MRRWSFYFLPLLAGLAFFYGLFWVWAGVRLVPQAEYGAAAFLVVFGVAGVAVGMALWSVWKKRADGA